MATWCAVNPDILSPKLGNFLGPGHDRISCDSRSLYMDRCCAFDQNKEGNSRGLRKLWSEHSYFRKKKEKITGALTKAQGHNFRVKVLDMNRIQKEKWAPTVRYSKKTDRSLALWLLNPPTPQCLWGNAKSLKHAKNNLASLKSFLNCR